MLLIPSALLILCKELDSTLVQTSASPSLPLKCYFPVNITHFLFYFLKKLTTLKRCLFFLLTYYFQIIALSVLVKPDATTEYKTGFLAQTTFSFLTHWGLSCCNFNEAPAPVFVLCGHTSLTAPHGEGRQSVNPCHWASRGSTEHI